MIVSRNEESPHGPLFVGSDGAHRGYVGAKYQDSAFARYYATKHDRTLAKRISNWREHYVMAKTLALLAPFESVLDLPSGTGRFWKALSKFDVQLLGSDRSAEMLKLTARYDTLFKRHPLRFVASALEAPLPAGAVDVAFCARLIHHFPDHRMRIDLLKELARIARKGVVVSFFDAHTLKHRRRLKRQARFHKMSRRYGITRAQIMAEASEAGLTLVGMHALLRVYAELTAAAFRHGPSAV